MSKGFHCVPRLPVCWATLAGSLQPPLAALRCAPRHPRHVICRAVSSTLGRRQQSRPSKRVRGLKKQMRKEKVENSHNVLRLAIDCGLNSHYSMSPKVGGAGGWSKSLSTHHFAFASQELRDLSRQVCLSYGAVMQCPEACQLHLVGLEEGGGVEQALGKHFPGYTSNSLLVSISG